MKRTFVIVGLALLGVAFVAATLWVILSGNRSARAVRTKFRIGGAMLTLAGLTTLNACTGCYDAPGEVVTCYDPVVIPPTNQLTTNVANNSLRNGDIIVVEIVCEFKSEAAMTIYDTDHNILQSETFALEMGTHSINLTLDVGEYRGDAILELAYSQRADKENEKQHDQYEITIVE